MEHTGIYKKWRHITYKIFFAIFVLFVIVAIIELQPSTDVPAPTIYGILLILMVDAIYYELIIRKVTGRPGNSIIRRYFNS